MSIPLDLLLTKHILHSFDHPPFDLRIFKHAYDENKFKHTGTYGAPILSSWCLSKCQNKQFTHSNVKMNGVIIGKQITSIILEKFLLWLGFKYYALFMININLDATSMGIFLRWFLVFVWGWNFIHIRWFMLCTSKKRVILLKVGLVYMCACACKCVY